MKGWIKIDRGITEHWLWHDAHKLQRWLDLLLNASFEDNSVLIGNKMVEVKRGQLLASNAYLSTRWKISVNTTRTFLQMLENDNMITRQAYPQYNIITISNYALYQDSVPLQLEGSLEGSAEKILGGSVNPSEEKKLHPSKSNVISCGNDSCKDTSTPPIEGVKKNESENNLEGSLEGSNVQNLGPTKEIKNINNNIISLSTGAGAYARESNGSAASIPTAYDNIESHYQTYRNDILSETLTSESLQRIALSYGGRSLNKKQIVSYLDKWQDIRRASGNTFDSLHNYRSHFTNWFRIELQKEKNNNNGNNQRLQVTKPTNGFYTDF